MTQRAASPTDVSSHEESSTRLRIALRLAFSDGVADELAVRRSGADDAASVGRVLRAARSRLALERLLRLTPWRRGDDGAILGASSAARPDEAVALIARIGLGLDVLAIAEMLDTTPENVAASLFAGRRAIDRPIGKACERYAEAIGEYDDPSADPDDRVALVTHARSCQSCREAIERSRQVDIWLQGELDRVAVGLADGPPARDRTARLRPELLLPAGLVLLIALLVLGGFTLFSRLTSSPHVPVPARMADAPERELTGWLVTSGQAGQVEAENLRTGEIRVILPESSSGPQWSIISPDRSRLALIRQTPSTTAPSFHADIYNIDGTLVGSRDWSAEGAYRWPIGWLDNETMLVVESPMMTPSEGADAFQARLRTESVLLRVDVATGQEHAIARGDVGYAVASPDGSMVVVFHNRAADSRFSSVSLRPLVGAGLGDPVWSSDAEILSLLWSPDGGALFAMINSATGDQPSAANQLRQSIIMVDRSGTMTTLVEPRELGEIAQPVVLTPDGGNLIIAAGDTADGDVSYWLVDLDSGDRDRLLGAGGEGWPLRPLWSPDGAHLLLPVREQFYLSTGNTGMPYPGGDSGIALFSYDAQWQRREVGGWLDTTRELLAWLPEERFPSAELTSLGGAPTITAPEPVRGMRDTLQTSRDSAASPGGRFILLYDGDANIPVIWDRQKQQGRQVSGDASELAWLPSGRAVFGVVPFADTANRLAGFAASSADVIIAIDFQRFDPVGLAENMQTHYERPLVSPDGTTMSFFVVDEATGEVALWLAGWGREPGLVTTWSTPKDAIPSRPLSAAWIDAQTLLFARADDWDRGMPRQAVLSRVVVDGDDVRVDDLTSILGRGVDRGVVIREMAVSPDGMQLAYRLRHFRAFAPDRDLMDTVQVVALTDVTRPIELISGGIGAGISWAPDSRWLVTATTGRIVIASSDGRTIRDVNEGLPGAAHPVWVGNEVWFSVPDSDSLIWRVVVRE